MKRAIPILVFVLLLALAGTAQTAQHVVIVTIDGFHPDFYLDTQWHTTHLRQLMEEGTYAEGVNSVFPSITYPSHTTIVTGVQPVKHGIYYNSMFEPARPTGKLIYWNFDSIEAPTIWAAAAGQGLKVSSLFWPVSAEAPVTYNIPDIGSLGEAAREKYSKPEGFVDSLKNQVFDGASRIDYGKDENVARIAAYVIARDRPNLLTIHLFSVDHAQHMQGRHGDLVQAAIADADSSVGIIIGALRAAGIWDKTVLIVTGDHGFLDVTHQVNPNVWLAAAGLIGDVKKDDWKAQFYSAGGSDYLYLKDRGDKETLKRVMGMLAGLPKEEQQYFRIIDRRQLDAIGANPEVALALSGLNGASFGNSASGEAVLPGKGGTHGYFPDFQEIRTGFVAAGPGIRRGGIIPQMNLKDIAPVVAQVLGFPFPSAEGKIPGGLLTK
jgi:predicted AlkP superfamily phosphohydrolase/phosphomutase